MGTSIIVKFYGTHFNRYLTTCFVSGSSSLSATGSHARETDVDVTAVIRRFTGAAGRAANIDICERFNDEIDHQIGRK